MNKRILFVVALSVGIGLIHKRSMQGMKRTLEEPESKEVIPLDVTLVADDGQQVTISRESAEQSAMIKASLTSLIPENRNKITVPETSGDNLRVMVDILNGSLLTENIDNFVIDTFVDSEGNCNVESVLLIAKISDYLGVESLTISLMRLYIFQILRHGYITMIEEPGQFPRPHIHTDVTIEQIQEFVEPAGLKAIIKEQYSFITTSAGFQALNSPLVNRNLWIRAFDRTHDTLYLRGKGLTNVYGLLMYDNKSGVESIVLSNNDLDAIPNQAFIGFDNLKELYLDNTQLKFLAPKAFEGLSNLEELYLYTNQLQTLNSELFRYCTKLQELDLRSNPLTINRDEIKNLFPASLDVNLTL